MSTTSLKIPNDLKQLAKTIAQQQGISPHAFMVDAIRVVATAADKRAQMVSEALSSKRATLATGVGYGAAEVKAYLLQRTQGQAPARPATKSWRT
jgi:predicted transcriptional regulator